MSVNMIQAKNEIQNSLLSKTRNCETFIHQTHTKLEETLESKMIKPSQTFGFNPPILIEGSWMIGLNCLEVYNSISNLTRANNKFELYIFRDEKSGGVSYEKVRDKNEGNMEVTDITATDLRDDIIGPVIIDENRKQVTKTMNDDKYMRISSIYVTSMFQDFESFLRSECDLVEDDIKLVSDE